VDVGGEGPRIDRGYPGQIPPDCPPDNPKLRQRRKHLREERYYCHVQVNFLSPAASWGRVSKPG
jgi:hypothetical protein